MISAALVGTLGTAHAQTTFASITGVVTDASGSAVPNATVTAINQQTNIRTSTKSSEGGNYTIAQLKEGRWIPDEDAKPLLGDNDSLAQLKQALQQVREETLAYLDSLSEDDLDEFVKVRTQGLPAVPRAEVFRTIASHENYHLGQLISYLWARGDNPYEW